MAQVGPNQYAFDFTDETANTPPDVNWYPYTEGNITLLVTAEDTLKATATSGDVWASCWPATGALSGIATVDIVQKFRFVADSDSFAIIGYLDGGPWQAASLYINGTSDTGVDLSGQNYADKWDLPGLAANTWHWVRTQFTPTSMKIKFWTDGQPEPATWELESNSETIASGAANFGMEGYGVSNLVVEWDYLGFGVNGAAPPMPATGPDKEVGISDAGVGGDLLLPFNDPVPATTFGLIKAGNMFDPQSNQISAIMQNAEDLELNALNVPVNVDFVDFFDNAPTIDATSKATAIALVEEAHDRGLKVILEPFPFVQGGEVTETGIDPPNKPLFFANWKAILQELAEDIAEPYGVHGMYTASNLVELEQYESDWISVFNHLRNYYSGHIMYRTNWWWESNAFLDKLNNTLFGAENLDVISIACYFELSANDIAVPTIAQLINDIQSTSRWDRQQKVLSEIRSFAEKFNKPIFFGELGCSDREYGASEPWNWNGMGESPQPKNETVQANFFAAYRKVMEPYADFWWRGFSTYQISYVNSEFYPVGKQAEPIIAEFLTEQIANQPEQIKAKDFGQGSDQLAIKKSFTVSDAGQGADTEKLSEKRFSIADGAQGAEGISTNASGSVSLGDTGQGTAEVIISAILKAVDSGQGADTITIKRQLNEPLDEEMTDSAVVGKAVVGYAKVGHIDHVADEGLGDDSTTIQARVPALDGGAGTESISVSTLIIQVDISDSGEGDDALDIARVIYIEIEDAGTTADDVGVEATVAVIQVTDEGVAVEQMTILPGTSIPDTAKGTDSVFAGREIHISDAGFGDRYFPPSIVGQAVVGQTRLGRISSVYVEAFIQESDAGEGVEDVAYAILREIKDTGIGTSEISVTKLLFILEEGFGTDGISWSPVFSLPTRTRITSPLTARVTISSPLDAKAVVKDTRTKVGVING